MGAADVRKLIAAKLAAAKELASRPPAGRRYFLGFRPQTIPARRSVTLTTWPTVDVFTPEGLMIAFGDNPGILIPIFTATAIGGVRVTPKIAARLTPKHGASVRVWNQTSAPISVRLGLVGIVEAA